MEPNEKIPVPASFLADQEKAAKRRETIGELREYLGRKQQEALDEEPYGYFKSRMPIQLLKDLTQQERDELFGFEESEHARLKPLTQTKHDQRGAFIRAGGTAEAFDAHWEAGGKDATIAQRAGDELERAARDSVY